MPNRDVTGNLSGVLDAFLAAAGVYIADKVGQHFRAQIRKYWRSIAMSLYLGAFSVFCWQLIPYLKTQISPDVVGVIYQMIFVIVLVGTILPFVKIMDKIGTKFHLPPK
jgi:hypothetical protein